LPFAIDVVLIDRGSSLDESLGELTSSESSPLQEMQSKHIRINRRLSKFIRKL